MPKYRVNSQIRGLEDPKRVKGVLVEHVLEPGDVYEMPADKAEQFLKGGAVELDGPTDEEKASAAAAAKAAAEAEEKRRAALTNEQRKAEDEAAKGGK